MKGAKVFSGYRGTMLILLSIGLAVIRLGRRTLPPLLPTIINDLSISAFQAGLALSIASVGFAAFQFPGGRLSDQLTRKTVLLLSLSTLIVGSAFLSFSESFVILLVGAAIIGIGEGLYGAADRGLLSDLYEDGRGIAFGIHTVFSDIGGILAAVLAALAISFGVWQAAYPPILIGLILIGIVIYFTGDEPIVIRTIKFEFWETGTRLLLQRRFRLIVIAYMLFSFAGEGFTGFLPALLQTDHGFSPELATFVFGGMFATGIVARPMAGWLSDRLNRLLVGGIGLLIGSIGVTILVFSITPLVAILGVGIFAFGQKSFPPTMQAHLMDQFPNQSMAGDIGATRTIYIGIGSLGPAYVGYLASQWNYTLAFTTFIGIFFISTVLIFWLFWSRPSRP